VAHQREVLFRLQGLDQGCAEVVVGVCDQEFLLVFHCSLPFFVMGGEVCRPVSFLCGIASALSGSDAEITRHFNGSRVIYHG
jgi:hypothetical protein